MVGLRISRKVNAHKGFNEEPITDNRIEREDGARVSDPGFTFWTGDLYSCLSYEHVLDTQKVLRGDHGGDHVASETASFRGLRGADTKGGIIYIYGISSGNASRGLRSSRRWQGGGGQG